MSTKRTMLAAALLCPVLGGTICKNHPLHSGWPSAQDWSALNQSTNGALIRTSPVASSCFHGNPFASAIGCDEVQKNWFYSAFHADQPESIGYSYWANNSCVPPNDYTYTEAQRCELGGFPQYILNATSAEQIATATKWASSRDIRIVVKGTGHDLNGRSSGAYSLSIWTHHLRSIKFDANWPHPLGNKTENAIIIESGNSWGQALHAAAAVGRTVVSGQDPTVGLGGFIGGGGHGPLSSHYGLSADQVLQATLVTTEGRILVANDAQNQDLLWAVRGGGPGLYGIVVGYVLRTVPLPDQAVLATLSLSIIGNSTSERVHASWNALTTLWSSLPDVMDIGLTGNGIATTKDIAPNSSSPFQRGVEMSMTLFGFNTTVEMLSSRLNHLKSRMIVHDGNQTISVNISEPTVLPTFQSLFDALNPGPSTGGQISLISSRLLGRRELTAISFGALRTYLQSIMESQVSGSQCVLIVGLQGGSGPRNVEMGMRGALTPAWRNAYLHVISTGANVNTTGSTPQDALETAAAWTEDHKEAIWREWVPDSGSYINEANPFNSDFKYDFYGGNYDRLLEIKEKYDPIASMFVQSGVGSHSWNYDLNSGKLCRKS